MVRSNKGKIVDNEEGSGKDTIKKNVINIIANSLNRAKSSGDDRSVLMLIAALGLINAANDSSLALSVARRLSTVQPSKK